MSVNDYVSKFTARLTSFRTLMKEEASGPLHYYIIPGKDAQGVVLHDPSAGPLRSICGSSTVDTHLIVPMSASLLPVVDPDVVKGVKPPPEASILVEDCYKEQVEEEVKRYGALLAFQALGHDQRYSDWFPANDLQQELRVGIDQHMISYEESLILESRLRKKNLKLVYTNYLDRILKKPNIPERRIREYHYGLLDPESDSQIRLEVLRFKSSIEWKCHPKTKGRSLCAVVIHKLPSIAYLLNLGVGGVMFPVFKSCLVVKVQPQELHLYVDRSIRPETETYLRQCLRVEIRAYDNLLDDLVQRFGAHGDLAFEPNPPRAFTNDVNPIIFRKDMVSYMMREEIDSYLRRHVRLCTVWPESFQSALLVSPGLYNAVRVVEYEARSKGKAFSVEPIGCKIQWTTVLGNNCACCSHPFGALVALAYSGEFKITAWIHKVLEADTDRLSTYVDSLKGDAARCFMDMIQHVLDEIRGRILYERNGLKGKKDIDYIRRRGRRIVANISESSGLLPSGFFVDEQALGTAEGKIGSLGGYAEIEKMRSSNNLLLAVKKAKQGGASEEEKKIFRREALVWRQLYHDNVVRLYGVHWPDQNQAPSLVLPYMADGDIRSYLGSRILSVQEVKKWLFNIAVGLNYLHDNDIVHADLRAVNVLVSRNSEGNEVPQITDFGLSRFIATTSAAAQIPSKQSKTEITGNTRWLAPEVIILKGHKHTRESDVWSFGWLCWEIATGTHPLPDLIEPAVYTEVAITYTRPRRDIECKNTNGREIADELWILMEACWSRMPEKRLSMKRIGSQLNPKKKKNSLGQTE